VYIKMEGEVRAINAQVLDVGMVKKAIFGLMTEAQIETFEAHSELNFGLSVADAGRFRVNVFRQRGSVAMVARYITSKIPSLESSGMPPVLKDLVLEKRGLILVVGATGSGKSTTLASMIDHRNTNRTGHILTIEDPIEFVHKHKKSLVNQREIGIDTETYASALVNSLREDVSAAFDSVKDWLLILEQFYYLFRLKPFTRSIANSLKKEAKAYLYDWVEVPDEAFRFENLTALHLYKAASLWRALGQANTELFYLRDKQKREADFLLTENGKPAIIIECKQAKEELSDNLLMFQRKTGAPLAIQLVHKPGVLKKMRHNHQTQWVISAECFLKLLP